ncbi:MAG: Nif3-like dinuclear metal center hexameric protein [Verrucomicrobiae bacterium]|nr:Nif3-like dinuclear metal center hexameric protein [Verrucomicrobiae bacterium]
MMALSKITNYLNNYLQHAHIADYSGAKNGLQLANNGRVSQVMAAVDANGLTVAKAIEARADLLLVHHGLFWNEEVLMVGARYGLFKAAMDANLAIYSSHLPLDAHPKLGNNVLLSKALKLASGKPAFEEKGTSIGRLITTCCDRKELCRRLGRVLGGEPKLIAAGPRVVRRLGVITGGAGNRIYDVAKSGIDTFVTGEGSHWTFGAAHELKINLIYGGHYATETFGVKALANHVGQRFRLRWSFIDVPSGL